MKVTEFSKGRTITKVRVEDVENVTDEAVLAFALSHARESKSSLFGWNFNREENDEWVMVTMHTD